MPNEELLQQLLDANGIQNEYQLRALTYVHSCNGAPIYCCGTRFCESCLVGHMQKEHSERVIKQAESFARKANLISASTSYVPDTDRLKPKSAKIRRRKANENKKRPADIIQIFDQMDDDQKKQAFLELMSAWSRG